MSIKNLILLAAVAMSSVSFGMGSASAATVTFDDAVGVSAEFNQFNSFSDQGLTFTQAGGFAYVWPGGQTPEQSNGTNNLIFASSPSLVITKTGGGNFDLSSADFTLSWYSGDAESDTIQVTGFGVGGPVSQTLTLFQGFQTYGLGLANVSKVEVSWLQNTGAYWGADNLNFADAGAVPEPATWAMMVAGFGLVGGAMRRRSSSVSFATA